jgi:hypothetical protein
MKFLFTMNMPSAQGYAVHQVTVEYPAESVAELCEDLNENEFILCRQLYRQKNLRGEPSWLDRGDIVINTYHIGKVQQFIEFERDYDVDESQGRTELSHRDIEGPRGPIRPRRPTV